MTNSSYVQGIAQSPGKFAALENSSQLNQWRETHAPDLINTVW